MHIAIIMDGNGRWAARRHLPRSAGHRAGAKAVDAVVAAAARHGIDTLTLYAFSAANWSRPRAEVNALFALLRRHLLTQTHRCLEQSIRINVIGRRDRLRPGLLPADRAQRAGDCALPGMRLRIAVDYSAQHSLLEACRRLQAEPGIDRRASPRVSPRSIMHGARARGRSPDPHRWRAALERFPAVGVRVRRAALRRVSVAGFRPPGLPTGARGVCSQGAALWRNCRGHRGTSEPWIAAVGRGAVRVSYLQTWRAPQSWVPHLVAERCSAVPSLLLNPFYPKDPRASFGKHVLTPTLALTSIAGATPPHWDLRYWDENLLQGPPPCDPPPQVVGITVHLTFARRAYELAAWYRRQGSLVILGGLHVLSCPERRCSTRMRLPSGTACSCGPPFSATSRPDRCAPAMRRISPAPTRWIRRRGAPSCRALRF